MTLLGHANNMFRLIFIILAFSLNACFQEKDLFLIANGVVPIYKTLPDAVSSPSKKPIIELQKNQQVQVIQCIDAKHYQIYKIHLPNGKIGYVNEGNYMLTKNKKLSYC